MGSQPAGQEQSHNGSESHEWTTMDWCRQRHLIGRIGWELKVSIKIYPACCPFNRIDRTIVIFVEFLKMVV
jgi:hypothetical protein